ncbi:hypothetical protein EHN07_05445 [Buttiauxella warmboldiae]|uniref:HTH luxR-type domain-containing protein n=1 Tax=Buttiauxella warmboldiae TaxID=82993 RepID=A0A3N5ED58_9ENTR|nr:hypothetical protein [Buttiauxella warmboldiae]RPH29646.1 hypothetical protein EHN07_05445 [Buttiauxella warmboldiae]
MNVRTSQYNYYFLAGVSGISEGIRESGCYIDFAFYQFERYAMCHFLSIRFLHSCLLKNSVLIASDELLPLALHYLKNTGYVIAVFRTSNTVNEIIAELSAPGEDLKHRQSERWSCKRALTAREVFLLDLFINGYSIQRIAYSL